MKELLQRAKQLQPELVENRRWLHRHPELGFDLTETCAFVEEKLKAMGYAPQRMSKTGIVATVAGRVEKRFFCAPIWMHCP